MTQKRELRKTGKLALSLLLLGSAYSAKIVPEQNTNFSSIMRSIASEGKVEEVEVIKVTKENIQEIQKQLGEELNALINKKESFVKTYEDQSSSSEDLIRLRDEDLPNYKELLDKYDIRFQAMQGFLKNGEYEEVLDKAYVTAYGLQKKYDKSQLGIEAISLKTKTAITTALKRENKAQKEEITELKNQVCEQNKTLSSLQSDIKKLLEDKEEVVTKVDYNSVLDRMTVSPLDFFSSFSLPTQRTEQNPYGLDMNFLLLAQLMKSSGFGGAGSVYYAPSNVITYNGVPHIFSSNSNSVFGTGNFGLPQLESDFSRDPSSTNHFGSLNTDGTPFIPQFHRGNALLGSRAAPMGSALEGVGFNLN